MNKILDRRLFVWLLIAVAFGGITVALGAGTVGVDVDQKWGSFRRGLLILGLVGFVLPLSWKVAEVLDNRAMSKQRTFGFLSRVSEAIRRISASMVRQNPAQHSENATSEQISAAQRNHQPESHSESRIDAARGNPSLSPSSIAKWLSLSLIVVAFELLYVWLVSAGHMDMWPNTGHYYDMLADAFLNGQTALEVEPSRALAELENPYSRAQRQGIFVIGDASYFRGKYYIYWGPAPAAFVAVWKLATGLSVGDEQIVFIAVSSIFLISMLIILHFKRRHFKSMPGWLVATSLIVVATSHPILWVLNWPSVHMASIASGQAFLLAGLLFALPVIEGSARQLWRLALIGSLWLLAIATRLTLVGAVAVLVGAVAIGMVSTVERRMDRKAINLRIATIVLPLAIGIGILGLYNYVRFGSAFESGLRYQLAEYDNNARMNEDLLFNAGYLLPNSLYYSFAPPQARTSFPFIRPNYRELQQFSSMLYRFDIPAAYHIQSIGACSSQCLRYISQVTWCLNCWIARR